MKEIDDRMENLLMGRKFKKIMDKRFQNLRERSGLKQVEVETLVFLEERPNTSASDIYRTMGFNKGHVSQALDRMGRLGLVLASPDADDRRYTHYSVTEKGLGYINEAKEIHLAVHSQLFAGITEEECLVLEKVFSKIIRNIEAMDNE